MFNLRISNLSSSVLDAAWHLMAESCLLPDKQVCKMIVLACETRHMSSASDVAASVDLYVVAYKFEGEIQTTG